MVTPASPDPAPHRHRELAESFGADTERYDRSRPRYPQELVDTVLDGMPSASILDVGIGTGISALGFRAAGADVIGVEVDPRMAEYARSRGFEVEVSRFEDWEPQGRVFDAVIAGQTWHWIDPVTGAAKAGEIVRPGGRLALFWNVGDPEPDVREAFADVYRSVETGLPFTPWAAPALDGYAAITARVVAGIDAAGMFSPVSRSNIEWQTTISRDAWLDQVPTAGGHQRIPKEQLGALLDGMGRVVDANGGSFTMRYVTVALIAERLRQ